MTERVLDIVIGPKLSRTIGSGGTKGLVGALVKSVKLLTPVVLPMVIAPIVVNVVTATRELIVERFEDPIWEGLLVSR